MGHPAYQDMFDKTHHDKNLVDAAKALGLNSVVKAIEAAGLTSALSGSDIYTCYLPNDAAFAKVPNLDALLSNKAQLAEILKYHVVPLRVRDEKVIREFRLSNKVTAQGGRVKINVRANPDGGEQLVVFNSGEATAVKTDIETKNGHIHIIDGVLTPQAGTTIPVK